MQEAMDSLFSSPSLDTTGAWSSWSMGFRFFQSGSQLWSEIGSDSSDGSSRIALFSSRRGYIRTEQPAHLHIRDVHALLLRHLAPPSRSGEARGRGDASGDLRNLTVQVFFSDDGAFLSDLFSDARSRPDPWELQIFAESDDFGSIFGLRYTRVRMGDDLRDFFRRSIHRQDMLGSTVQYLLEYAAPKSRNMVSAIFGNDLFGRTSGYSGPPPFLQNIATFIGKGVDVTTSWAMDQFVSLFTMERGMLGVVF